MFTQKWLFPEIFAYLTDFITDWHPFFKNLSRYQKVKPFFCRLK